MTNKSLKRAAMVHIAVLISSVLMLAAMSFAWFVSSRTQVAPQTLDLGRFEVRLTDAAAEVAARRTVAVDAAYPMTQAAAEEAYLAGEKNVYTFRVENLGTVPAQIRLSAQVRSDTGYGAAPPVMPLSGQIRYSVKLWRSGETKPAVWPAGNLLFGGGDNLSFKQYCNGALVTESAGVWTSSAAGTLSPAGEGADSLHAELLVWLDAAATVESTGAYTGAGTAAVPRLTFDITMHAIQAGGGAAWNPGDLTDLASEAIPEGV